MLYVDLPFQGELGGDKNRSKFIWNAVKDKFEVDLLLIKTYDDPNYDYQRHTGQKNLYTITTTKSSIFQPKAIYRFSRQAINKFKKIIKSGRYDYLLIRFASPCFLADITTEMFPNTKIIIDIDMLMSRLNELSWKMKPTFENRYYYFENLKLKKYEKILFEKPYLFLFTNYHEMEIVHKTHRNANSILKVLPNVIHTNNYPIPKKKKEYILFFGCLNSAANKDAFNFIVDKIYPLIQKKLGELKIKIRIVGKKKTLEQEKTSNTLNQLELIGRVKDINEQLANSLFVLLPIRIASGTRTRILEAASTKTAVISTTNGAEGLEFESDEIIIRDSAEKLAEEIMMLLENPYQVKELGKKLYHKCNEKYLDSVVADNLIKQITTYK